MGALGLGGVAAMLGLVVVDAIAVGPAGAVVEKFAPVMLPAIGAWSAGIGAALLAICGFMVGSALCGAARRRGEAAGEAPARAAAPDGVCLRLDAAVNNMSQGLCLYDRENVLQVVNRRFCEIYRVDPARIVPGITFRDVLAASIATGNHAGTDVDGMVARRLALVARRTPTTLFQELSDGRVVAVSVRPTEDGGWVGTYEDITERRRAEAQITYMARHDQLTGLPNRGHFRERIEAALETAQPFAVLSLDLDSFCTVNESFGHRTGDAVLCEAARRIVAAAPEGSIVARLAGDEFALIQWPLVEPDSASCLAERLLEALSEPMQGAGTAALGASIGIAIAPGDGNDADALLTHAELACSLARREGGGSFRFFEPGMDARQQKRRLLEADLRGALARGEFQLHYQPLVAVPEGTVTGFEALVRWRHPRRGLVSPGEFIPLAEHLLLIGSIGSWVIARACADAARFPGMLRVSVNVSPLQFSRPGLVEAVADALSRSGLDPARLELEITESVMLDDSEMTRETLHRLRGLGVRIALDDFGTGYSSLRTLRSFPIDRIKIDQSFTRDLGISPDAHSIVNAIAALGRSLGMSTTAEGVETEEQLESVIAEGCVEAQGFLFSRPRPAEEIPALLRTLEARREARVARRILPRGQAA